MGDVAYTKGLHRLAEGTWAYLSPPGSWGWSNCGLVASGESALLVDTQFDLPMTAALRGAIAEEPPAVTVDTVVTTHANGDHCWGNQLFDRAEIVSSAASAHGLSHEIQPEQLRALSAPDGPSTVLGAYMRRHFGHFDFFGIAVPTPSQTFSGRLDVVEGDRTVELVEVGPAHTDGDVIVHVPDAAVVFAGDILFVNDHPIMWTGPAQSWIAACERIVSTGARYVVPGHGPVTDIAGVRLFRDYLGLVAEHAEKSAAVGLPYWRAAAELGLPAAMARWGHRERLVITMSAAYANLGHEPEPILDVLARMAEFDRVLSAAA